MNQNENTILKTLTTQDMTYGGLLNPAQQDKFVQLVKNTSVMLKEVRFHEMSVDRETVDKMYINGPVSRGVGENDPTSSNATAKFGSVPLTTSKIKTDWFITSEVLYNNIENPGFEDTIMESMAKAIATDMENTAISGDTALADPLLGIMNGWDKITNAANIVDAGGDFITPGLLKRAKQSLPAQYAQDPGLRWFFSSNTRDDWNYTIGQRQTDYGDMSLAGTTTNVPFAIPVIVVPQIPDRKTVIIGVDAPAEVAAVNFGPYEVFEGQNDLLNINIDLIGAVEIQLSPGLYPVVELIQEIKNKLVAEGAPGEALLAAATFKNDLQDRLVITTISVGAAAQIDILATSDPAANFAAELGIAPIPVTVNGTVGADGTVNEGSFLWLANPKNFIFGMLDKTRIYTEFNKDNDRTETTVYNQFAVNVENLDAIVKIVNLRTGTALV